MKKALVAWLVLLVMAISSIGFAEEDVLSAIGDWTYDEKGNFIYVNETLNLQFNMGNWFYYRDKELYADEDGLSVKEWLKSVQTTWDRYDYSNDSVSVMYGQSKNRKYFTCISMNRIAENDELTDERITEFFTEEIDFYQQNWEPLDIGVGTINFLGKERPCLRIKHIVDKETFYTTFVPVVNNGYFARIRLTSKDDDRTDMIVDKWSLIKK